jgi:hypothetical protein
MDLRDKLKYGDMRLIAEISGSSYDTVRSVLTGRRGKRSGQRIKNIAADLIGSREELTQKISRQNF